MPSIQVKVIEKVFTPEQTQQIVRGLTDAMVAIEGENMRPVRRLGVRIPSGALCVETDDGPPASGNAVGGLLVPGSRGSRNRPLAR